MMSKHEGQSWAKLIANVKKIFKFDTFKYSTIQKRQKYTQCLEMELS